MYHLWKYIDLIVSHNRWILADSGHLHGLVNFGDRAAHFNSFVRLVTIKLPIVKLHWLAGIAWRHSLRLCKLCPLLRLALLHILNLLQHELLLLLAQLAQNVLALLLLILDALQRQLLLLDTDEALDCIQLLQSHLLFIVEATHALGELLLDLLLQRQDVLAFVVCVGLLRLERYLRNCWVSYMLIY